jgi:hypothetical protein
MPECLGFAIFHHQLLGQPAIVITETHGLHLPPVLQKIEV